MSEHRQTNSTTNSDPGTNNTGKKYKVAIVQLADNGAFTEMRESFIQEMRTLGYDEAQMIFDIKMHRVISPRSTP